MDASLDKETIIDQKLARFQELYKKYITQFVDKLPKEDQDEAIDFLIAIIGQEMVIADATKGATIANRPEENHRLSFLEKDEEDVEDFPLRGYNVLGVPCSRDRLVNSIKDIVKEGFRKEKGTYEADVYPEIKLAVVDNGRHHLSVAGLIDEAVANAQIFRFENVVDSLTTDGAYWCIMDEYGYTKLEEAESAEIAFLYELYRHKNCRKRGAFCVNCGCRVDYTVTPTPDRATIRGIEFDYVEQIATCNQCGSEVYVADIYNANVQMREEAFRKAKDLPKPI